MDLEVKTLNIDNIKNLFCKKHINWKKINYIIDHKDLYPNIINFLNNYYNDSDSLIETIYRIKNDISKRPVCPICGKKIKLSHNTHIYFPKSCSNECSNILMANTQKENCIKKYGVSNPAKLEISKLHYKETCLSRYGVDAFYKSDVFKNKSKSTCLLHYGVEHNLQIKDIHNKGVKKSQSHEVREKRLKTILDRYNVDNTYKIDSVIRKRLNTLSTIEHRNKLSNILSSKEIKGKIYNTKKKNNSFNKSKQEDKAYKLLKEKYPDVIRQYNSDSYPFDCDFYIPSKDLYIEYNGTWTHNNHPYDKNNKDDQLILEKWKSKNTDYYNNAIYTWTNLDVRKRNIAKENNLNYIEFWNLNEVVKWINFVYNC